MFNVDLGRYYEFLIEAQIATEDEVDLITKINGYNEEALDGILYARMAYHDLEQVLECEPDLKELYIDLYGNDDFDEEDEDEEYYDDEDDELNGDDGEEEEDE